MAASGFEGRAKDSDLILFSFAQNLEECLRSESPIEYSFIPSVTLLNSYAEEYLLDIVSNYYYECLVSLHSDLVNLLNLDGIESLEEWIQSRNVFRDKFLEVNLVFKDEKRVSLPPKKSTADFFFQKGSLVSEIADARNSNSSKDQRVSVNTGTKGYLANLFNNVTKKKRSVSSEDDNSSSVKSGDSIARKFPTMNLEYQKEVFAKEMVKETSPGKYIHSFGDFEPSPRFSDQKHASRLTRDFGSQTEQTISDNFQLQETLNKILKENSELKGMILVLQEKLEGLQVKETKVAPSSSKKNFSSNKIESKFVEAEKIIDPKTLKNSFIKASKQETRKSKLSLRFNGPLSPSFHAPSSFYLSLEELKIIFLNGKSHAFEEKNAFDMLVTVSPRNFEVKFWPKRVMPQLKIRWKVFEGDSLVADEESEYEKMYPGECKLLEIEKKDEFNTFLEFSILDQNSKFKVFSAASLTLSLFTFPKSTEKKLVSLKQKKYLNGKSGCTKCFKQQKLQSFFLNDCEFLALEKEMLVKAMLSPNGKEGFLEITFGYEFEVEIAVKCDFPEKPLEVLIETLLFFVSKFSDFVD